MALPQITIIGNLNKLETRFTTSGKEVTKFQVECSEKNAKGEWENLYLKGEVWEKASTFLNQYFAADVDIKCVAPSGALLQSMLIFHTPLLNHTHACQQNICDKPIHFSDADQPLADGFWLVARHLGKLLHRADTQSQPCA